MTATIPEVFAGVKIALADLGVQVYDHVPDAPLFPSVMMYVESWPYDFTEPKTVVLWCVTGTVETQGAQEMLGEWVSDTGPNSIPELLDADNTLGGAVASLIVLETRNFGSAQVQEGRPRLMQADLVCSVFP